MIYKTEATVLAGGKIILDNLPFEPGTIVTITLSLKPSEPENEASDSTVEISEGD